MGKGRQKIDGVGVVYPEAMRRRIYAADNYIYINLSPFPLLPGQTETIAGFVTDDVSEFPCLWDHFSHKGFL